MCVLIFGHLRFCITAVITGELCTTSAQWAQTNISLLSNNFYLNFFPELFLFLNYILIIYE